MAVDVLNSTTLSAAIGAGDVNFQVASTTNITAGQTLVVRGEAMTVNAVDDPSSGYVKVLRGRAGTSAWAHPISARVWIGNADAFKQSGFGLSQFGSGENAIALTGVNGALPDYVLPGTMAKDAIGNEYVALELTETVYTGVSVVFSQSNHQAAVLASGAQGSIAVMAEPATSDQIAWGQVVGAVAAGQEAGGTSAATSAYVAIPATSVSSPAAGMAAVVTSGATLGAQIYGMFITGVAVSTTTSATSVTGVTVPLWLNHPWCYAAAPGSS